MVGGQRSTAGTNGGRQIAMGNGKRGKRRPVEDMAGGWWQKKRRETADSKRHEVADSGRREAAGIGRR